MKLLIIDNDEGFSNSFAELLREADHTVTTFQKLDGLDPEVLHRDGYDLALIDRRLNDFDPANVEGESFALKLCKVGVPAVLVTGFLPESHRIFEMLWNGDISGILSKENLRGEERLNCIEAFRAHRKFPNGIADFEWQSGLPEKGRTIWTELLENLETSTEIQTDGNEICRLFRGLIPPSADKVQLQKIPKGKGGAALVRAKLSFGEDSVVEDLAVKYGIKRIIRSESMRYDRYIGALPDGVATQLRLRYDTENFSAIAYSWVGDSVTEGVPLGPQRRPDLSWTRRRLAISRLFSVCLNPWYQVYRNQKAKLSNPKSLSDYYSGTNGLWNSTVTNLESLNLPFEFADPALQVVKQGEKWRFATGESFFDPIAWMKQRGRDISYVTQAPAHGDLHVGNFFVLPDTSPRLIDFGRTSLGHVFRDFAALEVSLRLTCIGDETLDAVRAAEEVVSEVKNLGQHLNYRDLPCKNDLREVVQTTMDIRRAALDCCGSMAGADSIKEYLFAVLMHMFKYASGSADEASRDETKAQSELRIWQAHYSAAKIVDVLRRILA